MLLEAENPGNITRGNSFSEDGHAGRRFDYMLSNPPFGVEWKQVEKRVKDEAETLGHAGRFGAGLPRINDGSFLFLQHMIAKMKPARAAGDPNTDSSGNNDSTGNNDSGGSRIAIVFNGSPLFTGDAGSGESEIRRWIIENDWLEAIVALPDQLFFNTGISTYLWIVSNRKSRRRKGKVQLINAVAHFQKMRKSLGNKRHELGEQQIERITRLYGSFRRGPESKIFANKDFGFAKIVVERPLKLAFQVTPERLALIQELAVFQKLAQSKKKGTAAATVAAAAKEVRAGQALQAAILDVVRGLGPKRYTSRAAFDKVFSRALKAADIKLPTTLRKALMAALSERDERAELCTDKHGNPEPDPDLRDTENVPLGERIETYFEREVLPHVPDAWIDESRTKVGYEIPLTRHFYEYQPLRPLHQIGSDIQALEVEIQGMLREVLP